jgi:hypothetical protein
LAGGEFILLSLPLVVVEKLISASTKFIKGTGRREHKEDIIEGRRKQSHYSPGQTLRVQGG